MSTAVLHYAMLALFRLKILTTFCVLWFESSIFKMGSTTHDNNLYFIFCTVSVQRVADTNGGVA